MKILIIKLSSLGDVIHTLPCLNAIRQGLPESYIGWVVEPAASELLMGHPQLDEVFVIPRISGAANLRQGIKEYRKTIAKIRSVKFDVAIDFQGLTKSGIIARLSGARTRIGFGDEDGRELNKLFTNVRISLNQEVSVRHVIKKNFSLLKPLGIKANPPETVIPIEAEDYKYADSFLAAHLPEGARLVALNQAAGWVTKQWEMAQFASLGGKIRQELDAAVLLLWGPGEQSAAISLAKMMKKNGTEAIVAPPTTVKQLAALLARCDLYVGGDTGPTHLAAALGVPVVAFFGASDANRNAPYTANRFVIQKKVFDCVPCWKTYCREKGQAHLQCLKSISVDEVFYGVKALLAKS